MACYSFLVAGLLGRRDKPHAGQAVRKLKGLDKGQNDRVDATAHSRALRGQYDETGLATDKWRR